MSEDYWDGALWVFHADIVNDVTNSGPHTYSIVPGAGNEMELLYGTFLNGDTSNRTFQAVIDDGANSLGTFVGDPGGITLNLGESHGFPVAEARLAAGTGTAAGQRFIIAGTMRLRFILQAVSVNQDSALGFVCRIRGGLPTVTLTSPTDAAETVNTNQVF